MARAGVSDGMTYNRNVYHTIPLFASLDKQFHLGFVGRGAQLQVSEEPDRMVVAADDERKCIQMV
jgi:hypothetical protein